MLMKWAKLLAYVLVVVGALNWGLIALTGVNLVTGVVGSISGAEKIVYILVGLSAVWVAVDHKWKL